MDFIWSDKRLLAANRAASALHTNCRNEQITSSTNTNSIRKIVENYNCKCCARINKGICRRRHQRTSTNMARDDATTQLDNSECSGTNYKFECDSIYMTKNNTLNNTLNNTKNNNTNNAITYNSYHKNYYNNINSVNDRQNVNCTKQISDDEYNWQNRKIIDFCRASTSTSSDARIKQFVKHAKQKRTLCEQWIAIMCYFLIISSFSMCEAHKYDGTYTQPTFVSFYFK